MTATDRIRRIKARNLRKGDVIALDVSGIECEFEVDCVRTNEAEVRNGVVHGWATTQVTYRDCGYFSVIEMAADHRAKVTHRD